MKINKSKLESYISWIQYSYTKHSFEKNFQLALKCVKKIFNLSENECFEYLNKILKNSTVCQEEFGVYYPKYLDLYYYDEKGYKKFQDRMLNSKIQS